MNEHPGKFSNPMKLDKNIIDWIEDTISKICRERGYGHVCVTWHVKGGKIDGTEKRFIQTEKDEDL